MSLGFISHYDASDVRSWSGIPYFMAQAMRQEGLAPELIGPLCEKFVLPFRFRSLMQRRLGMKAYLWERDPLVLDAMGKAAAGRLRLSEAAIAFSPGTMTLSHLKCRQPIVFWTDMPFDACLDFYSPRAEISSQSLKDGHAMEQAALDRASLAIFSSNWARDSAIANYRVDPSKVKTIPFGCNITWDFNDEEVRHFIEARSRDVCNLVFVGVNWQRKGGAFALDVARLLMEGGIRTHLTILGCQPDRAVADYVTVRPFLNKSNAEDLGEFQKTLAGAHFLILPTRADCTPMVIGEANSLGVPCLVTDVGGIPSQIRNGVNGKMFELSEAPEIWADWTTSIYGDRIAYEALAQSSFQEYASSLNWTSSIRSFAAELNRSRLL
jgi:glycosyltransferase involved in cell wall biosynthesis